MATVARNVKPGDILSSTQYLTVKAANAKTGNYTVVDDSGLEFHIEGNKLIEDMACANQFTTTEKVSRTELAEIFKAHPRTALTVNYNLKVNEKDVVDQLMETYPNNGKIASKAEYQKNLKAAVKLALEGTERTMIGRHYNKYDDFGRIQFIDMEAKKDEAKGYDTRYRLVDPRTINWIIVNGVKYTQK